MDTGPIVRSEGRIYVLRIASYRVPTTECVTDLNLQDVDSKQESQG